MVEVNTHQKLEVEAESNMAVGDISVVSRGRAPGMCSSMAGFGKNLISALAVALSGDELVEKLVEVLDTETFVITAGG